MYEMLRWIQIALYLAGFIFSIGVLLRILSPTFFWFLSIRKRADSLECLMGKCKSRHLYLNVMTACFIFHGAALLGIFNIGWYLVNTKNKYKVIADENIADYYVLLVTFFVGTALIITRELTDSRDRGRMVSLEKRL